MVAASCHTKTKETGSSSAQYNDTVVTPADTTYLIGMDIPEYKIHQDPHNRQDRRGDQQLTFRTKFVGGSANAKMGWDCLRKVLPDHCKVDPGNTHHHKREQHVK